MTRKVTTAYYDNDWTLVGCEDDYTLARESKSGWGGIDLTLEFKDLRAIHTIIGELLADRKEKK